MSILLESLRTKPVSFELTDSGLSFKGPDAQTYVDSQTTNRLSLIKNGEFQFNSVLDLSGKIIGSFLLAKISEDHIEIYFQKSFQDDLYERFEKFHISEDFELTKMDKIQYINLNSNGNGIVGRYIFEDDIISGEALAELGKVQDLKKLQILSGVPTLGEEAQIGELINNTYFDELSVDYKKGCFPGQETVSKINTRRGAAYKPVLGISSEQYSGDLIWEDKKIGKILNSFEADGTYYHYISLLRNYRIDGSKLGNLSINYFPYISVSKKDFARELYDEAVDLFQNNKDEMAKDYFEQALSFDPEFEDAYESLGVLYGRMEQFEKAIELMEKLKSINSKSMMAYTNLSLYHMKIGNIDTAEDFKSQATLLNFELLGDEAERKRKEEEIAKQKLAEREKRFGMFQQVLEMDAEDAMANNGMGEILLEKGDPSSAVPHFKQAISTDKKYSVAYLGLAKCLIKLNKTDELKEVLENGIEVAGKNGDLMPANEMQSLKSQYL